MDDIFNEYSKEVMKYFLHPKNMGVIKNADGVGVVGNPRCGDVMKVYIKVAKRPTKLSVISYQLSAKNRKPKTESRKLTAKTEEYIKDIKVQTMGCGAAIASSSMATVMVKGKSLDKALEISNLAVTKALGGLPRPKTHCSVLAKQGIMRAIEDYRKKSQ